jgi:hypothetical protein
VLYQPLNSGCLLVGQVSTVEGNTERTSLQQILYNGSQWHIKKNMGESDCFLVIMIENSQNSSAKLLADDYKVNTQEKSTYPATHLHGFDRNNMITFWVFPFPQKGKSFLFSATGVEFIISIVL